MRKLFELAQNGDVPCLRIVVERLWPQRKGQPVNLVMPSITNSQDVLLAFGAIWTGVLEGRLTPEEASDLCIVVERSMQAIEQHDVLRRIAALEEARDKRDEKQSNTPAA